jgi:hypothetical protein
MKLTIKITTSEKEILSILGEDPLQVVESLIHHTVDGVVRPGSWERGWLQQVFGSDFESRLENDPKCFSRQRPKRSKSRKK